MSNQARVTIDGWGLGEFLKKGTRWALRQGLQQQPFDEACYRYSLRRIRARQADEDDVDDVLDTVYQFSGAGRYRTIAPIQVRSELASAVSFVSDHQPSTVMEIGTANGGTFYTWCRGLDSVERAISIDLPRGSTPSRFLDSCTPGTETTFVRGDSHSEAVYDEVVDLLDDTPVDFLFIDGDHTFDGVKQDFDWYAPLVSDDGLIAFHDIVTIEEDEWNQVDEFWETLSTEETVEFRDPDYDPHQPMTIAGTTVTGHGIGILQKSGASQAAPE